MNNFGEKVSFIWSVADLLRGPYKPAQYGDVMLPLTVLRRLDCVLAPTRDKVQAKIQELRGSKVENLEPILNRAAGQKFHNRSRLDFEKLKGEPDKVAQNLTSYIKGFSTKAREIIEHFGFEQHIEKLEKHDRLYLVVSKFAEIDLHPDRVPNLEMGYIFEELIRRFKEQANEEAGDHFTPREVIRLMVNLIFSPDGDVLTKKGIVKTLYDPACGTGGMLSVAHEYLHELNPDARLQLYGQDYNDESFAICGADMLIKGEGIENIKFGDSFTQDGLPRQKFDYMLANPPFGVEWKPQAAEIEKEHEEQGMNGRFGASLPRINDGSFLFLQHMISKMKPVKDGGTRLAIVFNGSPLFTGDAGSGESEIRRWIIENDWLEAVVALPDQLFYNTGIFTYLWIVTNRKPKPRRGKVQLINAVDLFKKMRKSLGQKRNEITTEQITEITQIYGEFREGARSKIFENQAFGYRKITVERPLKLNWRASPERLDRLFAEPVIERMMPGQKVDKKTGDIMMTDGPGYLHLMRAVGALRAERIYTDRATFVADVEAGFEKVSAESRKLGTGPFPLTAPLRKAILSALSERDEEAKPCLDADGNPEPDPELRDFENVPLTEDVGEYLKREVLPHVPDAWVDETRTKVGYEIPFTRPFYVYQPPRPLEKIEAEIKGLEGEIVRILGEVVG